MNLTVPKFGKVYVHYQESEARAQQNELAEKGIDSEVQYRSSMGMLPVVNWAVYTDEETKDLTDFRNRTGK